MGCLFESTNKNSNNIDESKELNIKNDKFGNIILQNLPNKENRIIPMELAINLMVSVCKIITEKSKGTGFFMQDEKSNKYLVSNYHVINHEVKNIKIGLHNKKEYHLNLSNRYIKYLQGF